MNTNATDFFGVLRRPESASKTIAPEKSCALDQFVDRAKIEFTGLYETAPRSVKIRKSRRLTRTTGAIHGR